MPTDIATRAVIMALRAPGYGGKTSAEINTLTGIPVRTINDIYARAISRGFQPGLQPLLIRDEFLADAPRSGRPKKHTKEKEEEVIAKVQRDRYDREKTCAEIAGELSIEGFDISAMSVWRILHTAGFHKTKPTRKPGLTKKMKKDQLEWCLAYKDWTLED